MNSALAIRTDFSIGESVLGIKDIVKTAKSLGEKSVAIMDTMSVTAMIDFTKKCKDAEIQPIIGCRMRFVDDVAWKKTKENKKAPPEFFLNFYVMKESGMKTIYKLLSKAYSSDRFYMVPKLSFDDLYEALKTAEKDSIKITTGDILGVIHHKNAGTIVAKIISYVGSENVYANLCVMNTPYWHSFNLKVAELAQKMGIKTLVTKPSFYEEGNSVTADIMSAITSKAKIFDPWALSPATRDSHLISLTDLRAQADKLVNEIKYFRGTDLSFEFEKGFENTGEISDKCEFVWSKMKPSLPVMAPNEFAKLKELCVQGWKKRFTTKVFDHMPTEKELDEVYKPRLVYELQVLNKLGFSGYFLLVEDVVSFAKKAGILVGPGRGSVGGSLVAYLIGITDCDPIRFGLLFERFINPDRIDLPDADLDFMSERRGEIIEYITNKFGKEKVAGVSNFQTLAAASSIRDVSRVIGLPESEYSCSKLTPKLHGQNIELAKCAIAVDEIKKFSEKYPGVWSICTKVEGSIRNMGRHAAGVVVAGCDLTERSVVERRDGEAVVNWDKRIVEDQGLIKMDILGLQTLDLIDLTMKYVQERHSKKIDIMSIPLDDEAVLNNFAKGLTIGVFQFESGGMRRLLKELGSDGVISFDDITAATALYRPGPMESGMMDSYYKRKQGVETTEYDHPDMEPVLKPTFGVFVYQEQVMQVARVIAGYSGPDADKLRKIMGKKLPEEMEKERGKFVEGCVNTVGADKDWAEEVFDKIAGFAGYGFNKSHSVEYALISYQSMWLKTYYPVEFFAAALSLMADDKLPGLIKDAEKMGVKVSLPDINKSTHRFEILSNTDLAIPFSRVKGLSETAAKHIVDVRKSGGPFKDKLDFETRTRGRMVHSGKIETLDKIGSFASIEPSKVPINDPSRILDQRELIPGLISENVPVNRDLNDDKLTKVAIAGLIKDYRNAHGPSGDRDGMPVSVAFGKDAKFMCIQDAPNNEEEREGRLTETKAFGAISEALSEAGMNRNFGYWTALIKRAKVGKQASAEEISKYKEYLAKEIEILKPPVIVLLGSQTVRHFFPDFKGKASDMAGSVVYSREYDANFVIGFSPGEIYYAPEKQQDMNNVFAAVASLLE